VCGSSAGEYFGDVEGRWISRVEAAFVMPRCCRRTAVTGMGGMGRGSQSWLWEMCGRVEAPRRGERREAWLGALGLSSICRIQLASSILLF